MPQRKPNSSRGARADRRRTKRSLAKSEVQAVRDRIALQRLEGRTPPPVKVLDLQEIMAMYGRVCIERDALKEEVERLRSLYESPRKESCTCEGGKEVCPFCMEQVGQAFDAQTEDEAIEAPVE